VAGDTDRPSYHREPKPVAPTYQDPRTPKFITSPVLDESETEPVDPASLKRGWRLHYKGPGVEGVPLTLGQRCVPLCVDVRSLWVDVRETFPGMGGSILIDRLLDKVVTRARHAERMAESSA
jgi:hypothetical protein